MIANSFEQLANQYCNIASQYCNIACKRTSGLALKWTSWSIIWSCQVCYVLYSTYQKLTFSVFFSRMQIVYKGRWQRFPVIGLNHARFENHRSSELIVRHLLSPLGRTHSLNSHLNPQGRDQSLQPQMKRYRCGTSTKTLIISCPHFQAIWRVSTRCLIAHAIALASVMRNFNNKIDRKNLNFGNKTAI